MYFSSDLFLYKSLYLFYKLNIFKHLIYCISSVIMYISFLVCSVAQSCPTLCNPMDGSPPSFSDYGIFQARILEWAANNYSTGSY